MSEKESYFWRKSSPQQFILQARQCNLPMIYKVLPPVLHISSPSPFPSWEPSGSLSKMQWYRQCWNFLHSYPRKMFAANLQPSWPSRPQTKGTLLFYFLKLYNFGFDEIFEGSTSSELQHPWISKIRCEPKKKKIAKKSFFRLNFEVLVINRFFFWNFLWSLQFGWILNYEFIKILHVHIIGMKNELTFM